MANIHTDLWQKKDNRDGLLPSTSGVGILKPNYSVLKRPTYAVPSVYRCYISLATSTQHVDNPGEGYPDPFRVLWLLDPSPQKCKHPVAVIENKPWSNLTAA